MSVYKPEKSPYYQYDFQIQRRRFHGSTGRTDKREAKAVERSEREKARALLKVESAGVGAMTLDIAAGRYWNEVGKHYVNSATTWTDLGRIIDFLGKDKLLVDIGDDDVAWRRGHRVKGRMKDKAGKPIPVISAATVNRSTVQAMQAIFTRAKRNWHARFDHEPGWKKHRLREPGERARELHGDQARRLTGSSSAAGLVAAGFVTAPGGRLLGTAHDRHSGDPARSAGGPARPLPADS